MMNFTKSILVVKKSNDEGRLFDPCFVYVCNLNNVFQSALDIWCKTFLDIVFNAIICSEKRIHLISETGCKNFQGN